jgi:hypothetical protein
MTAVGLAPLQPPSLRGAFATKQFSFPCRFTKSWIASLPLAMTVVPFSKFDPTRLGKKPAVSRARLADIG